MKTILKYLKKKTLLSPLEFFKLLITSFLFVWVDKRSLLKFFRIYWGLLCAKHFTGMSGFPFYNLHDGYFNPILQRSKPRLKERLRNTSKVIELGSRGHRILTQGQQSLRTVLFAAHQAASNGIQTEQNGQRQKGGGRQRSVQEGCCSNVVRGSLLPSPGEVVLRLGKFC